MDNRFIQNYDNNNEERYQAPPRPSAEKISRLLPERRRKIWPYIVAIVVIIGAIAGAGIYFTQKKHAKPAKQATTVQNTASQATTTPKLTATVPTETYSSSALHISIRYPKGWTANETNSKVTINSPTVSLPANDSKQTSGQIVLTIQPKQATLPAFSAGNAQAVRDSEKLTYANPSSAQRGQTYLSFLHYAGSATETGIDGLHITGDSGYLAQQYIPKTDVLKGDPLISVTFSRCDDAVCSNPAASSIAATGWDDPNFSGTIRPILTSLVIN